MHSLRDLQTAFQNYLLTNNSSINSEIVDTSKVSASARLEVYRDAYYLRLLEILEQDYPGLRSIMGIDVFDQFGREYIDAYPSQFRSVRWFGKFLPEFLQNASHYNDQPYLIEMAQFEWLLSECFDAKDHPAITVDDMAMISPEKWPNLIFKLHPSVRRIDLHWNIVPIWNANQTEKPLPSVQKTAESVPWIIWRKNNNTQFYSLTADKAYMLDAIANHNNFESICEGLCTWINENEVGIHAAQILKQFILDDMLVEIVSY